DLSPIGLVEGVPSMLLKDGWLGESGPMLITSTQTQFQFWDVSDPSSPQRVGQVDVPARCGRAEPYYNFSPSNLSRRQAFQEQDQLYLVAGRCLLPNIVSVDSLNSGRFIDVPGGNGSFRVIDGAYVFSGSNLWIYQETE
ncbi:MAG: hypothetical protein AAF633_27170, partial [Chloroflexota bacterium]